MAKDYSMLIKLRKMMMKLAETEIKPLRIKRDKIDAKLEILGGQLNAYQIVLEMEKSRI